MMIEFIDVSIEGFGSIHKLKYKLNNRGLTILRGPNGVGKTTIFSALYWALTGKLLKEKSSVEPWAEVKHKEYIGTRVSVRFKKDNAEYIIYRHQNYKGKTKNQKGKSQTLVYINNQEEPFKDKKQTQEFITKTLGMSSDLFKNSIIFGQKIKRLIEEDGPMKKKILEEVFEVDFISKAKTKAENTLTQLKNEYQKINIKLIEEKGKYATNKALLSQAKELQKTERNEQERRTIYLNNQLAEVVANIKNCEQKIQGLPKEGRKQRTEDLAKAIKAYSEYEKKDRSIFALEMERDGLGDKRERLEKEIEELGFKRASIPTQCSLCGSKLSREALVQTMKVYAKERKAKKKEREILIQKEYEIRTKISKESFDPLVFKQLKIELDILKQDHILLDVSLRQQENEKIKLIKQQDGIKAELRSQSKVIENFKGKIQGLKKENIEIKKRLRPIKKECRAFKKETDLYEWIIKDPLGNSGIKAFIFNQMIELINNRLLHYSGSLGFEIKLGINMESANKDLTVRVIRFGKQRNLADFSGGEAQLINVSIAFALHDVVSSEKDINIILFDEVFEALDKDNVEIISGYIQEKSKDKSIHLITHLKDFEQTHCNIVNIALEDRRTLVSL